MYERNVKRDKYVRKYIYIYIYMCMYLYIYVQSIFRLLKSGQYFTALAALQDQPNLQSIVKKK